MRIIACEQGSAEWLAARTGRITASRFKDVRGTPAKRRGYLVDLAWERITGDMADCFVNDAMKRGTELEPAARIAYESLTGELVDEVGICMSDCSRFGYSPDGFVGADGLLEIKCPTNKAVVSDLWITRDLSDYMDQMQGGMWITGRAFCDFVCYDQRLESVGMDTLHIRVARDDAYIDKLVSALHAFDAEVTEYTRKLREAKQ